jgi:hypothetical protein
MNTSAPSCVGSLRALFRFAAVLLAGATLLTAAAAADLPKKSFDIPAGDAASTLRTAAQQAGREIMFPAATVQGVRTAAVKGELTVIAALERMLSGTDLRPVQDEKTGALAVRREGDPGKNAASRPVPSQAAVEQGDGTVRLGRFEVTGQRVTGLINQGVIPRQEREAIAFTVLDRSEIESMGATDINEVFRALPQVAAFESESRACSRSAASPPLARASPPRPRSTCAASPVPAPRFSSTAGVCPSCARRKTAGRTSVAFRSRPSSASRCSPAPLAACTARTRWAA